MAGGNIVDVLPEEGGYSFQRDDGSSVFLLSTPETDDLANRISSFKSAGMTAGIGDYIGQDLVDTAQAAVAPPPSMADVGPNMSAAPAPGPAMSVAPPPAPAAPPAPPMPQGAPTVPASAEGLPGAPGAAQQQGIYDPASADAIARMAAMRPGSPGISQAQLQRKAQQGVEMPTGTETTVEGALPYDEELAAQRAMATEMGREARVDGLLDQRLELQAQEEAAQARMAQLQQQFSPARQAIQHIEQRVAAEENQYRALKNEVATGKVDPRRIFSGPGGALVGIGSAIAAAMGAYGATLGRTNNFALDLINAAIDRDIRSQEEEFARKGQAANNMYRDLMNTYGDRDQARAALSGLHQEYAKQEAAKQAARSKSAEAVNAYQQWLADDVFKEAETERKIRELSYGKHTQRMTAAVQYPQAGSRGRMDGRAYADYYLKTLEAQGKAASTKAGVGKTLAETDKANAEAQKARSEATGGSPEERERLAKTVSAIDATKASIEAVAKKHGYELDPKTGELKQTGGGFPLDLPDPTFGVVGNSSGITGLQSDLASIGVAYGRVVNEGGEPSADLARQMMPQYGPTTSPNNLAADLQAKYQEMLRRENIVKAGVSGAARATREREKQNVNVERASTNALPAPERF